VDIVVRRGDVSWTNWIDRLTHAGHWELVSDIESANALVAGSRWFAPGAPLPRPAPGALAGGCQRATSKRITGEAQS
jgi:hypothetical protein